LSERRGLSAQPDLRALAGHPVTRVPGIFWNAVETIEFQLRDESIRLCDLLKAAGIADSGGQGKHLVASGEVTVDSRPESRKTARIRAGQTVGCRGVSVLVCSK
jgi:ribosome-associated protein